MDDQKLTETLTELHVGQARIEAKLDSALARQEEHQERLNDHSRRLHGLERFRWLVIGGGAVLGFLIAARENVAALFKALGR